MHDAGGFFQPRRRGQRSGGAHNAGEPGRVGGLGELERPQGEIGSRLRGRPQHLLRRGIQAGGHRRVSAAGAVEQVGGGGHRRAAASEQHRPELTVQCLPGRRRHRLGDRPPDQLAAEGEVLLRAYLQYPGSHRLTGQREHDGRRLAPHLGHVFQLEGQTQHGRGLQQVLRACAEALEPAPGHRTHALRQPRGNQGGRPLTDPDGVLLPQSPDELDDQ